MKSIKKIIALFLLQALCLTACACQNSSAVPGQSSEPSSSESEEATLETEEITLETEEITLETEEIITEAEAKAIAEGLIENKVFIEYVIFRAGLETDNDNIIQQNDIHYAAVTDGYTCTDDLKAEITSVFTADYIENTYYMSYFDGNYPMYIDCDGILYMNIDGGGGGYEEYAYDNIVIESCDNDTISGFVPGQTAYGELIRCSFTLSSAEGSWKISAADVSFEE